MHPLDPIRLRDLSPAARREERRLRATKLADGSSNLSKRFDRLARRGIRYRPGGAEGG